MQRRAMLLCSDPRFLSAQVSYERLAAAAREPQNWLTYSGSYASQRYSVLEQITPQQRQGRWSRSGSSRPRVLQKFETTPLVVDGIMYLTQPPNDVVAIDARTGRVFWIYQYRPAPDSRAMLRRRQSRTRDSRRHPVHGHRRRPA